ncbi:MAG TPA: hypothetical protein VGQ99_00995 [Tepidisphaeraceae bacterium]|jgi:hypothetical protein|nr:hypothetical protein [Tepidisphaeraceae bacterium]
MAIDYDIVDLVSDLLQSEQAGAFHFMTEADPYINRAEAEIRRPLAQMIKATLRREGELAALIDELGSTPPPPAVSKENQYLAFLSVDFLLPKLRDAKVDSIHNYEKALRIAGDADEMVVEVMQGHLREHRAELEQLDRGLAHLKKSAPLSTTPM